MLDARALFESAWAEEIAKRLEASPSYGVEDYSVTGRAAAQYGGRKNLDWWRDNGPTLVDNWVRWRVEHQDWQIWTTPEGNPAIELELNVMLPGDIPVKMFIDRVFVLPSGELAVVDIKTGSRMPDTDEQLGFYATGIELTWGPMYRPQWGYFWDANKGTHGNARALHRWTPTLFSALYRSAINGINSGSFLPKPANGCGKDGDGWCSVARYCSVTGGPDAAGVDPLLSA